MYKSEFFTQINLHLYFDKIKDKDLIEQVLIFKSKRKFNPLVVMLLREHIQKQRDTFALDSQSLPIPKTSDLLKSIERIESVMSVSSDKSASITISNELSFLKTFNGWRRNLICFLSARNRGL